jgi:hypothetical protein
MCIRGCLMQTCASPLTISVCRGISSTNMHYTWVDRRPHNRGFGEKVHSVNNGHTHLQIGDTRVNPYKRLLYQHFNSLVIVAIVIHKGGVAAQIAYKYYKPTFIFMHVVQYCTASLFSIKPLTRKTVYKHTSNY